MRIEVRSPYDGASVGAVEATDAAGVERALRDRACALPRPPRLAAAGTARIEILTDAARRMEQRPSSWRSRRPGKAASRWRIRGWRSARAIDGVLNCCELLRSEAGHVVPMDVNAASAGRVAFTLREPIGVVVAVSAFNHPLNLIVHQVAPAIAAGCPVIVKPADRDAALVLPAGRHPARGGPAGGLVPGAADREQRGHRAARHRPPGGVLQLHRQRPGRLEPALAPGAGHALRAGARRRRAGDRRRRRRSRPGGAALAKGGFYHAGQVCVSVQRVFAHASIAAELAGRLAERARKLKVGDPLSPETEVGPLIRPSEVARVHAGCEEAVAGGGRAALRRQPGLGDLLQPDRHPRPAGRVSPVDGGGLRAGRLRLPPTTTSTTPSPGPTRCLGPSRRRSSPATTPRRCAPTAGSTPPPSC